MSHNVQISGIKINDLDALDKACAELRREGVKVSLERGTPGQRALKFRTFGYGNNDPHADHVVRLGDCKYDIGLLQQSDGHYEPVYDDSLGLSVECPIACAYKPGNRYDFRPITDPAEKAIASKGHGIGKLMQRYTAIVTEKDARRRGRMVRRMMAEDGTLQLLISA